MNARSNEPFDPDNPEQLGEFRYSIAGILRQLMVARMREEPDAFDSTDKEVWFRDIKPTNTPLPSLLQTIANQFKRFASTFCGYRNSEPCVEEDDSSSPEALFQQLRELVLEFTDAERLDAAARSARGKEPVKWRELAEWRLLQEIRNSLDQLPEPRKLPPRRTGPQFEFGPDDRVFYSESEIKRFTPVQFKLVEFVSKNPNSLIRKMWKEVWDPANEFSRFAVSGAHRRVNEVLRTNEVPWQLSVCKGRIDYRYVDTKRSKPPLKKPASAPTASRRKKPPPRRKSH
jgi:hypothetical protein